MSENELKQTDQQTEEPGTEPGAGNGDASPPPATGGLPAEPQPGAEPDAEHEPGSEPPAGDQGEPDEELEPGAETPAEEPPAEEPPAEEPAPPTPAAAAGLTEQEFERLARKFDKTVERYREQVAAFIEASGQPLIANEMDLDFCPGYIFHPQAIPLTEEQVQFARTIMGEPIEPPFEHDPAFEACSTCSGWGRVKTGSHVAGYSVLACHRCKGTGYLTDRPELELAPPPPAASNGAGDSVLSEGELAAEDAWGTPRSHPDWGKSPQYRSPNWQAELEAYKAGQPAPVL